MQMKILKHNIRIGLNNLDSYGLYETISNYSSYPEIVTAFRKFAIENVNQYEPSFYHFVEQVYNYVLSVTSIKEFRKNLRFPLDDYTKYACAYLLASDICKSSKIASPVLTKLTEEELL